MTSEVARHHFETTDADQAHGFVAAAYSRYQPRRGVAGPVRFAVRRAAVDGVGVDHLVNENMSSSVRLAPFESLAVCTFTSGRALFELADDRRVLAGPGQGFAYPVGQELTCDWDDPDGILLSLPLEQVRRVGAAASGLPAARVHVEAGLPLPSAARRWALTVRFFAESMLDPWPGGENPLLRREQLDLLTTVLLSSFPNTTMTTDYVPGPGVAGPATTRRAMQFIEANASLPITVDDIARAVGVDARSLQAAFRRHLGTSPRAHLQWVRLHAAHRDLMTAAPDVEAGADPGAGPGARQVVVAVAQRWGFARTSRFVAAYRAQFGVPPEHTLRQGW